MSQKTDFDILIMGGGIVGLTLAALLADGAYKVAVIDKMPIAIKPKASDEFSLRVSAINRASRMLFKACGIWDNIVTSAQAFEAMQVWDQSQIHFDAADINQPNLGHIIENVVIQNALIERLQNSSVTLMGGLDSEALAYDDEGRPRLVHTGGVLSAEFVIGADGANSWVRKACAIQTVKASYQQNAIVATIHTEKPHQNTAYQRFLDTGPLALLPLPEPNTCSIVWSADVTRFEELMALDELRFANALTQASQSVLGELSLSSGRQGFPLTRMHAESYIALRVALVGDAIHTIHPLAGLGLNLGLQDVAKLFALLQEADAKGRFFASHTLLRRYERARKGHNLLTINLMDGFKSGFGNRHALLQWVRNTGLSLVNNTPPVKSWFIKQAMASN